MSNHQLHHQLDQARLPGTIKQQPLIKDQNMFSNLAVMIDHINELREEVDWLTEKVSHFEGVTTDGWVTVAVAAKELGKSQSAVRQRIKHPTKPMPEGVVWKQDGKHCEIWVNVKNFKRFV